MNSSRNTDPAAANQALKAHLPLLIRWGVGCLMVILALAALAAKGEGEINFVAAATFVVVWSACLWKTAQSGFVVVAALIDKQKES